MKKSLIQRLLQLIPVLLGVTFITFSLTYLSPGDPAQLMLSATGVEPSPELIARVRSEMGLDQPFLKQYADWLLGLFQGDLGQSFYYNRPVSDLIADRLPATLRLAFVSLAVTMLVSVPLGIVSAMKQNKITDKIIRFITFGGISIPGFWVGMILMYVFALQLNMVNVTAGTGIKGMVLPVATLVFAMASKYTRYIRTAVLEEWSEPYVFALKAKGISKPIILSHYVLKSTMLSVVTMVGLSLGSLLGGAIVVEIVFSWPGVGQLAMDAIHNRDYPLIQGYVVWMSILYVGINFLVDVSYKVLDPRLRLEKGDG